MAVNLLTEEAFDEILASLETLKTQVQNWENLAEKWAENPEDVEVATGQYSALHHALKAASHKIAAETAKTDAETALASVQQIFDNFDDRYLGSKTSDPATDNDGDPLAVGMLYWNSTVEELRFYNGAVWEAPSAQAATSATNALASENKAADWAEEDEDVEVETGQYSAKHHALKALASAQAASTAKTAALASEQKAADWAEEAEDVEVETGQYSAKHYAAKAEEQATLSIQGIDFDAQVDDQVDLPAPPPEGDLAKYYIINTEEIAVYRSSTSSWNIASLGSVTVEDNLTSSSTSNALSAAQGKHLEDNKAERIEIAIPVDDMAALKALNPAIFPKALVGGFYSGTPFDSPVLFEYNASGNKSGHDGWSTINPDHNSSIGSSGWYSSTGGSTDDSGTGVWVRETVGWVDVKQGGAKGDDSNDDTTAIMAIVNTLKTNNDHGTVYFSEGTYRCNLTIYQDFMFIGETRRKVILKPHTDDHVIDVETTTETHIGGKIRSMKIGNADAGFTSSNGINIVATTTGKWVNGFTIEDCSIAQNGARGIHAETGDFSNSNFIQLLKVVDCDIDQNEAEGVYLEGKVIETTFERTFITKNAQSDPTNLDNFKVDVNAFSDIINGLYFSGCGMNHYEAVVTNSDTDGRSLSINGGRGINIDSCTFENGTIYLTNSNLNAVSITGNTFGNNSSMDAFITVHNCNGLLINSNSFRGIRTNDIYFDGAPTRYNSAKIGINAHEGSPTNTVSYASNIHSITSNALEAHLDSVRADGEGGADDLETIYSGTGSSSVDDILDGRIISLRRWNDAITVKHNTGNIMLSGASDYILDTADKYLILQWVKSAGKWVEIGRI